MPRSMMAVERMLEALRGRMLFLLHESPDPEWELMEMSRLIYEHFPTVMAGGCRPAAFVNDVFGNGVSAGRRMAEYALENRDRGFDPLGAAESAIDLLHRILPPTPLNHLD
jgi:hypothetical protein